MIHVSLHTEGLRCYLSNGIISMIWKEDASLESLKIEDTELIQDLSGTSRDSNAKRTFYVDYHAIGKFRRLNVSRLDVITNTKDTAHIAYIDTTGLLYIEYHIILKKGESGIYSYVIAGNNTDSEFELSELRTVYRFGNRIFNYGCNSERIGLQPTHLYMEQFECLQDETYRLPDGEKYTNGDIYSKYDYASYFSTNPAWGHFGHGFGFFVIPVSTEYYPGGPLKQELLVHYDGIILNYFTGAHFGTGTFHVPLQWRKCYGPYFLYINQGKKGEALYQDALNRAEQEKAKWPYNWVSHELYPLNRSRVTGTITFPDGSPCTNTTVILCKPDICLERQTSDYIFYTNTLENGTFQINHVRYGSYRLLAYQSGGSNTEQLELDNLIVDTTDITLNNITFPLSNRNLLWQLGKATRTCVGFKYGGELRNYKWSQMVPKNLDFTIGIHVESEDWYYAQTAPGIWNLNFNMKELPQGNYYLTIALAGICKKDMLEKTEPLFFVQLNGKLIYESVFLNDSSVYRSATKNGRYRRIVLPIEASLLNLGKNTISFLNNTYMVMYDTIIFEKDEKDKGG